MSHRLIDRSFDLRALRSAGFHLEVRRGHLLIKDVPYVTAARQLRRDGVLVSSLELEVVDSQEVTRRPQQHVAYWIGEHPCHADGFKIRSFENPSQATQLADDLKVDHTFSAKMDYPDYERKMLAYLGWIEGEAQKLDPEASARTFPVYAADDDDDLFHYINWSTSRDKVVADNDKLRGHKVAIVGVGGTGAYVLDFVAKTQVAEIRLFDGDPFDSHNAFRAPGAWSLAELSERKSKVEAFAGVYGKLRRRGIVPNKEYLTADNLELLRGVDFVFLCLDQGRPKRAIVDWLIAEGLSFIDVGMGVIRTPNGLQGLVRVITATPEKRDHINTRMSFADEVEDDNEYDTNIQIAELNALNAALAVIKWKRLMGFYRDAGREHFSSYQISTGEIVNEDRL
jgi:molybdopterin/thiamine biosynthesis adenylyltransferase